MMTESQGSIFVKIRYDPNDPQETWLYRMDSFIVELGSISLTQTGRWYASNHLATIARPFTTRAEAVQWLTSGLAELGYYDEGMTP